MGLEERKGKKQLIRKLKESLQKPTISIKEKEIIKDIPETEEEFKLLEYILQQKG